MKVINFLVEYKDVVFIALILLIGLIIQFKNLKNNSKEWLYGVCTELEKLGDGLGQFQLRQAYDIFVTRYPIFSTLIPFKVFSKWVKDAVDLMKTEIDNNPNFKKFVKGADTDEDK